MRDRKAAVRFAKALFYEALHHDEIDQAVGDLSTIKAICGQIPDVVEFLGHPLVPDDRKKQLCREHLGALIQPEQMRFLELLIDRQRVQLLPDIVDCFGALVDDHRGIVRAQVRSAVPLTEGERARLNAAVASLFGGQPLLDIRVHPELIGGMTVRVKDAVLDGSVRKSLDVLRADLQAASLEQPATGGDSAD
jgi:F-type H+-transporting ATPase subunit delta